MALHARRSRSGLLLAAALLTGAAGAVDAPAGAAAVLPAATPNPGVCNQLASVDALYAGNVWAVGSYCTSSRVERTLVVHYDGTSWRRVASPNHGSYGNALNGVVALSRSNAWAVGNYDATGHGWFKPLAMHWNGTAWRTIATANLGAKTGVLRSVTALSARNIWAVGDWSYASGTGGALVEHWNGTAWKIIAVPTNRTFLLQSVSAVAANDIWATGERMLNGHVATLALHWNGTAWRVVGTPNRGVAKNNFLLGGVAAISSTNAWAVGSYNAGTEAAPSFRTLVLHWNGTRWSAVASPNRGQSNLYGGVSGTAANNIWAVGRGGRSTLVEHWNGSRWTIVSSPNGSGTNELYGVSALSATRAFAVGARTISSTSTRTLVLRWNGTAWRLM